MVNLFNTAKDSLNNKGFSIVEGIYTDTEIESIISCIDKADQTNTTFRKSADLFAIRQVVKEIPEIIPFVFNDNLRKLIADIAGNDYFIVKSIYFDKPEKSNWYVAYHQDLTISVDKKATLENFMNWTKKQNQFAVQPPISILENITTLRIHLDETNSENGALKVIENSHSKGIFRPENIDWKNEKETTCDVPKGGVMLMKPLLLHSSNKTTNNEKRRVLHIELSNINLPKELNWAEKQEF
ncbi:phytanoyl-CoA dioxygenase family protein [Flavobacterium sp. CBA20B-1]|uniref:phytanoyl-CoA dioxygenase family protein n=1 Tax=unclassified Flavobacterium TaxID=196869 RepID=UPI00222552BC|nr:MULTISPECIES: phytanoyl-CoA dioxygenase family protein [unclassified Flavobacterium]WCM41426.1 phytanoyl-CoA dioxygenase family protein [Flavobacterium sp. CBA20B-1]